jgi:hypothetical protein
MNARTTGSIAVCIVSLFVGCAKTSPAANGGAAQGGAGAAGTGTGGGRAGAPAAGTGGSDCRNVAIPALCRICSDGSCGTPTCSAGKFTGFVCAGELDGGVAGNGASAGNGGAAGSSSGVCNLACIKGKHCVAKPTPTCVDDANDAGVDAGSKPSCGGFAGSPCPGMGQCVDVPNDGCDPMHGGADCPGQCECSVAATCAQGMTWDPSPAVCACVKSSGASLHWFASCGLPVCQGDAIYDDPNIPNCTTQQAGQACTTDGERCDGVLSCGATLICAAQAPRTCPISRARYKQDISYLDEAERAQFHDQITQLRLASYHYKNAPDVPQLGFMIDDVEPSVAVSGDHVNLYAYLSMAVAAIQVQDQQIKALQQQLAQVRASLDPASSQACMPEPRSPATPSAAGR